MDSSSTALVWDKKDFSAVPTIPTDSRLLADEDLKWKQDLESKNGNKITEITRRDYISVSNIWHLRIFFTF